MDIVTGMGYMLVSIICIMLSVYIALCFTSWISDVRDEKRWRYWWK